MKKLISIKTFLALVLFTAYNSHAIDIDKIAGLYDKFQNEYKYLSPVFGLIAFKSGVLENVRRHGNYGEMDNNFLCHKEITHPKDCPKDNTTALLQHLFPSTADGRLAISNERSDLFGQISIQDLGLLIKAYVENEPFDTFKQILENTSSYSIRRAWAKVFQNDDENEAFDMLTSKYAHMFISAKDERNKYPYAVIETALLALAVIKTNNNVDNLKPLLDELQPFQKQEEVLPRSFSKEIYNEIKQNLNYYKTAKQTFNELLNDPELLIFMTLGYDEYDNLVDSDDWRKDLGLLIQLVQRSAWTVKNALLTFYLKNNENVINNLRDALNPEELTELAPNILYGLGLNVGQQKLAALNAVATLNTYSSEMLKVVAPTWVEAMAAMNDEATNNKIILTYYNLRNSIAEDENYFINNFPLTYQLSNKTINNLNKIQFSKWWAFDYSKSLIKNILSLRSSDELMAMEKDGYKVLYNAAKYKNIETVEMLLEKAPELAISSKENAQEVLRFALTCDSPQIMTTLIEKLPELFSNPQLAKDQSGNTILHHAVDSQRLAMIELLLEKAPQLANDPDLAKNVNTNTPLYGAIAKGNAEIVEMLLNRVPELVTNPSLSKDRNGNTDLYYAVMFKRPNIVKILLEIAPHLALDPAFAKNNSGTTLLHYAAERKYIEILEILLEKVSEMLINPELVKDQFDKTALYYLLTNNTSSSTELISKLIKNMSSILLIEHINLFSEEITEIIEKELEIPNRFADQIYSRFAQ